MRCSPARLGCLVIALLAFAGCGDSKTDEKTDTKSGSVAKTKTSDGGKTGKTPVPPAKQKVEITRAQWSAEEEATCLVKQDGSFPDAKLKDLTGADRAISQLRGQRATVLLMWTDQTRANKSALRAISAMSKRESAPGVQYVAVCVGDDAGQAKQAADRE